MKIFTAAKQIKRLLRKTMLRGSRYYCPICRASYARFLDAGNPLRKSVRCPGCDSLERHRLLSICLEYLEGKQILRQSGRMLHVAPEACLTMSWKRKYRDYVTVDLFARNVKVRADITALCFPDACFDAIVCNHVLEHVPNDTKALAELYRSLKPGGWASIQVPILGEITQEDESITDPAERLRKFGQSDHVRQYGADFKQRLENAGFIVLEILKPEFLDSESSQRISAECEDGMTLVIKPAIES